MGNVAAEAQLAERRNTTHTEEAKERRFACGKVACVRACVLSFVRLSCALLPGKKKKVFFVSLLSCCQRGRAGERVSALSSKQGRKKAKHNQKRIVAMLVGAKGKG